MFAKKTGDSMKPYKTAIIGLGNIGMEYDITSANHPEAHTMAYVLNEPAH